MRDIDTVMPKDPWRDADAYWRNFALNEELHIAGAFIFDGLRCIDEATDLRKDDESFGILYNLAVGVERLCKIALVLQNHDDEKEKINQLEKSLITHSITDLIHRVDGAHPLCLAKPHNSLINLLTEFYNSYRYDRYIMNSVYKRRHEGRSLLTFVADQLSYKDPEHYDKRRLATFVGKLMKKIVLGLYEAIDAGARNHQIFTYEIRYGSKAYKILLRHEFDFFPEELVWKEILIHLVLIGGGDLRKVLDGIEPLDFLEGDEIEHLSAFESRTARGDLVERIECLYEEMSPVSERVEFLKYFGSGIYLADDEEE